MEVKRRRLTVFLHMMHLCIVLLVVTDKKHGLRSLS